MSPLAPAAPSSKTRTGSKVRVVNATPDVARMLCDVGLAWMLDGALPDLAPANEPMRRFA